MKQTSLINRSKQSFSEFWTVRDARERIMLTAAAAVIVLALTHTLLIAPPLSGRAQLNKNLPVLRQQVAQLQTLSKEAASLSEKPAPTVPAITIEDIEASLARKGLKPQSATLSNSHVQIKLASASFENTLGWLNEMQQTAQLSVVDANIVALSKPDMVDATVTLRQQRNE